MLGCHVRLHQLVGWAVNSEVDLTRAVLTYCSRRLVQHHQIVLFILS